MKCLAITNSYPAERLNEAHQVVKTLEGLNLENLEGLFQRPASPAGGPALAYCPDLLFTSKITDTGRHLGIKVEVANSIAQLEERATAIQPSLVLIDLGSNGVDYAGSIRRLRKASPNTVLIAYGSHVDKQLREQAKDSGCHEVYVRSEFVKVLPDLLRRYTTDSP
jgi:CheY-like chemotaxis protein